MIEYGEYCEEELDLCYLLLNANDNVIEVGSNIGSLTIPLSYKIPKGKLYAFEAQKVIYDMLEGSLKKNNISNVIACNLAIGDKKCDAFLPQLDYDKMNNFGGISITNQGVKVGQTTLDDLIDVDSLKLIKIDVEGMELEVLKGASNLIKRHRPFIYFENDRLDKSQRLLEFIVSMGYRIYSHNSRLFRSDNFKGNTTNIFKSNIIAKNALAVPEEISMNFGLKPIIF